MTSIPPLCVILGPTASGKSALALAVARESGAEILSVDSMQVYRGMDIGTAKPSAAERAAVVHHGIDLAGPDEAYTVGRFVDYADGVIADAGRRGVPLVVTGGTPLYYKALFEGLFEGPSADDAVRERLKSQPPADLHARLSAVDPAAATRIHANDQRRLVRALEVYELTGRPITEHQRQWGDDSAPRHAATWFGLSWDQEALNRRINARAKRMVADGWPDEVRGLLDRHGDLSLTASGAAGYDAMTAHVREGLPLADALERVKIATRQLAKRQVKWFRRFPGVTWLRGDAAVDVNAGVVRRAWTGTMRP